MEFLVNMGFSRIEVAEALQSAKGDVDTALDNLLSQQTIKEMSVERTSRSSQTSLSDQTRSREQITVCDLSQYSFSQGESSCTPIALTLLSSMLKCIEEGRHSMDREALMTDAILRGISHHSNMGGTTARSAGGSCAHLGIDETFVSMLGSTGLEKICTLEGVLSNGRAWSQLFEQARRSVHSTNPQLKIGYIGIVITKPPETVCVFLPPEGASAAEYFMFDSHSRPQHGLNGAYLVGSLEVESIISKLMQIFPALPSEGSEGGLMTMMYNSFEGAVFVRASTPSATLVVPGATVSTSTAATSPSEPVVFTVEEGQGGSPLSRYGVMGGAAQISSELPVLPSVKFPSSDTTTLAKEESSVEPPDDTSARERATSPDDTSARERATSDDDYVLIDPSDASPSPQVVFVEHGEVSPAPQTGCPSESLTGTV